MKMTAKRPLAGGGYRLTAIAAAIASAMMSGWVNAQEQEQAATPSAAPETTDSAKLDDIEVTGSRLKRSEAETSLPVEVVTRKDIVRAGYQSVEQLLAALTSASSIGGTQLSTGAGSSTFGVSTVSMRGLGEDRTLVLVNVRRVAAQAGGGGIAVNINTIPLSSIERVEVLKDGASSTYGSDAVAGVVNFILKDNYQGLELAAMGGKPTRSGGGDSNQVSVTGGYGNLDKDRFNITASASFEKEKALYGADRNFARRGTVLPFFASGATGQGNIEGAYTPGTIGVPYSAAEEAARTQAGFGSSPFAGYGNPLADLNRCEDINMVLAPQDTQKGTPYCDFDSAPFVGLIPDRDQTSLSGRFTFKFNDNHQIFADAMWAESKVAQSIQQSPVRRQFNLTNSLFGLQGVDPALLIRPSNPNYQIAEDFLNDNGFGALVGQTLAVTARVFDFGPRANEDTSTQSRYILGAQGNITDTLDYEVAYIRNESELKGIVTSGYFSLVAFGNVVNQLDSDYNPWSLTQSATFQQRLADSGAKYVGPTLNAESNSDQFEALVRGSMFSLAGGAAQFAAGAHLRKEEYINSPSPALETGDIAGLGGAVPPVSEKRDATAAFAEFSFPVLSSLEIGAGLRFDDYENVGDTFNYKLNAGWRPASSLLLRASTGTGFRAPSLEELYEPQTLGSSEMFDDPGTGQTDLQVNALTGGNEDLQPEESTQSSVGLVWQLNSALSVTLDYWEINIEDAINSPSVQLIVSRFRDEDPAYADLVTIDQNNNIVQVTQILQNTGELDVRGIDLGFSFNQPIGLGRIEVVMNGTYMIQFDEATPSGEISSKVGTNVDLDGNPVVGGEDGGVALRWKHVLSGSWVLDDWSATIVQNFYKGYEMGRDLDGMRRFVPSQSIYDLNVSYTGLKNTTLAIGVKNIFDTDPPIYIPSSNQFQSGYDAAIEDPRRQFVYISAGYKFF